MNIITLKNVTKVFTDTPGHPLHVLHDVDLTIEKGEFFVFLGPSGSGKSTLLRIMSGLEKEYQGEVRLARGITKNDIGFVFQQFALLPWLSVYNNVELPLLRTSLSEKARRERVLDELEKLGLEKFRNSMPHELSGGMKQRVGIARALVHRPKIMFLDEPFSELDSFTAEALRKEVLDMWHQLKCTCIMVTHLIPEAIELADRIAVLTPRPSRVERILDNTIPRPRAKRSGRFFAMEDTLYSLIKP
jgi:ABC-type nitrate/sulfonate/bicarbonate transport system ATPase subunit